MKALRAFLSPLAVILAMGTLLRLFLYLSNKGHFNGFTWRVFTIGLGFDLVTLALCCFPLVLLLFPGAYSFNAWRLRIGKLYLFLVGLFFLVLNAWDVAYFAYTLKRTSFNYFLYLLSSAESGAVAGDFILEFWWLIACFLLAIIALWFVLTRWKHVPWPTHSVRSWIGWVFVCVLTVLIGRGGFGFRPIGVLEATAYTSVNEAPLVLNTAFTVLKTWNHERVQKVNYYSESELAQYLPKPGSLPHTCMPPKTNVVILMLESFGTMYAGPNSPESYTPFLDSLVQEGVFFPYAIANGRTSMDAVPAILAGVPSWLNESFILSTFSNTKRDALPQVMKQHGYTSAFFHGASNGSMNFDTYVKSIGMTSYFGRNEYNNEADFDGNWGIWDHRFLPFVVQKLNSLPKPFFSTVFTLSSHHPYHLPKAYQSRVKKGPEPLCGTISYVDIALREFFKEAAKQAWYSNTVFVLCADHVGPTKRHERLTLDWMYRIPIAFYHPKHALPKPAQGHVMQQIDIMPSLMDMLGFKDEIYATGSSCFQTEQSPKMVYDNGNLISFLFDGLNLQPIAWNAAVKRAYTPVQLKQTQAMRAAYQRYFNDLLENRCSKLR
ncbi:MAG: hypothetical protein RLZZ301_1745 [Bacteroidota bacterium]